MKKLIVLFALFLLPLIALADPSIVPPSSEELVALIASLGGLKGAGALVIAGFGVQLVMLILRAVDIAGKYRLLLVLLLSLVGGVLSLRLSGMDLSAALVHSSTLAAFQVFMNQIFRQFFVKQE